MRLNSSISVAVMFGLLCSTRALAEEASSEASEASILTAPRTAGFGIPREGHQSLEVEQLTLRELQLEQLRLIGDPPSRLVPGILLGAGAGAGLGGGLLALLLGQTISHVSNFGAQLLMALGIGLFGLVAIAGGVALVLGLATVIVQSVRRGTFLARQSAVKARLDAVESGEFREHAPDAAPEELQRLEREYELTRAERPRLVLPLLLMAGGAAGLGFGGLMLALRASAALWGVGLGAMPIT